MTRASTGDADPPRAVLIGGDPATGKTTLGTRLAAELGAAVLDLDVVTGPLTDVVAQALGIHDLGDPGLAERTRGPRYATLFDVADANIRAGRSVVLVAPFSAERTDLGRWNQVRARLESAGAVVTLVWLHLPPDELVARLRNRAAGRDAAKVADPQAYLAGLDRWAPVGPHLALDASQPPAQLVRAALSQLVR
jgi:predicted kinase